jgi:hypothetical protein
MASRCSMQFEQRADVVQASDTAEGLRLAEAHPDLDVVFLDLNIPDQIGREVIPVRQALSAVAGDRAQCGLLGRTISSPPWESKSGAAVNLQEPQGGQQE